MKVKSRQINPYQLGSSPNWWDCPVCKCKLSPYITWHLCIDEKGENEIIIYDVQAYIEENPESIYIQHLMKSHL